MDGRYFSSSYYDITDWNSKKTGERWFCNRSLQSTTSNHITDAPSTTAVQNKPISASEFVENIQVADVKVSDASLIPQKGQSDIFVMSPLNQLNTLPTSEENESDFSSVKSFDDDINDKDVSINSEELEESDSEGDTGSEVDDENPNVMEKPKINVLSNIQIKASSVGSIASRIKKEKAAKTRLVRCVFCEEDTVSKNFMRHLMRRHSNEKEVRNILKEPVHTKNRKIAIALLRKETHFDLFIDGDILPARRNFNNDDKSQDPQYYPCITCKGLYKKSYLRRHAKLCAGRTHKESASSVVSKSQTFVACELDPTNALARLEVKEKVFDLMRGDNIAYVAKKDLLITYFGNSYLKKHRKEKSAYTCSNKMREFGRLVIECRNLLNDQKIEMQNLLRPTHFDTIVTAARNITGYDPITKTFAAPSLALHFGGNLKLLCDELYHLVLKDTKGFRSRTQNEKLFFLKDIKNMKQLIISRWNIEMASLANKDLQEKKWHKPLLIPLVSDVKIFRDEAYKITKESVAAFQENKGTEHDYKTLVQCVLALLIIFNRRRIGDVQYMKISDYKNEQKSNFKDFEDALSPTEKVLATRYRRVLNSGKGSRAVVVLIPEEIDEFIKVLLKHRHKYISDENDYLFSIPGHKVKWGRGDIAIRNLAKRMPLENPAAITSNQLRKQIATVMQILSLSKGDIKQFSNFMGHTVKTHEEFYELPVDVYQTAKVSKMLLMIENGVPVEHKGKSLSEIDIDFQYAEENCLKELKSHFNDGIRSGETDENVDKDGSDEEVFEENVEVFIEKGQVHGGESSSQSSGANLCKKKQGRKKKSIADDDKEKNGLMIEEEIKGNHTRIAQKYVDQNVERRNQREQMDSEHDSCSSNEDDFTTQSQKKTNVTKKNVAGNGQKRKAWSPQEVSLLKKTFSKYINRNIYPSTVEIRTFLSENNIPRDPVTVKSKLQHLMKLKEKK